MADLRITELPPLVGTDVQPDVDQVAVADVSASETKKVTPTGLAQAALGTPVADGGLANGIILADKINWGSITAESINGTAITVDTLPGDRLTDRSVTSGKVGVLGSINLDDGAVVTAKILDGAVTTPKIADAAVTSQKLGADAAISNISDNSLQGAKIVDGTIGTTQLADASVPEAKLAADAAIGNIADGSITTAKLMDSAVTTEKVADAAITSQKLDDGVALSNLVDGTVPGDKLEPGGVGTDQLADGGVTTAKLASGAALGNLANGSLSTDLLMDGAITTAKVGDAQITSQKLAADAAIGNITDGSLSGGKITDGTINTDQLADGSVTLAKLSGDSLSGSLPAGSITTEKLRDGAVTTAKIGDGQVTSQKLASGAANANIAVNSLAGEKLADGSVDASAKLVAGSVSADQLGVNSVTTAKINQFAVTEGKLADDSVSVRTINPNVVDPDGGLIFKTTGIGIDNTIVGGSYAGITYNAQGVITAVDASGLIPSSDLPIATTAELGAVSVPTAGGLTVSGGGALSHTNILTAGAYAGIAYDDHGHITSVVDGGLVPNLSLPIAGTTASDIGAVYVPTGGNLQVLTDGALGHINVVAAGNYTKVQVDAAGHVVNGQNLQATDIPDISADKIVGGELNAALLPNKSITREKLADYSISYIQEATPTALDPGHIGCLWYQESTGQLRMWNGNSWMPVGFGRLSVDNLRWGGLFDATTGLVTVVTGQGTQAGVKAGDALPVATNNLGGIYFVAEVAGGNVSVTPDATYTVGDWCLCVNEEFGWTFINANDGGGGGGGGGVLRLNDLLNVDTGTPADGALLAFNADSNTWVAATEIDCGTF